jgi:hypothetical protein
MEPVSDKRSADRMSYTQAVTLELSVMESGQLGNVHRSGVGVDISLTGMGLKTDQALSKGEVLKVSLPVGAMEINMPVYSEVMWTRPEDGGYRAGLRFLA